MRRCSRCGEWKTKDEWGPSNGYCRPCQRSYMREWRKRNPERMKLARAKAAAKHGWRKTPKRPDQRRAQWAVYYALKTGRLVRPEICPCCKEAVRVDAHHRDYSQPLDIEWLCRRCHMLQHADEALGLI